MNNPPHTQSGEELRDKIITAIFAADNADRVSMTDYEAMTDAAIAIIQPLLDERDAALFRAKELADRLRGALDLSNQTIKDCAAATQRAERAEAALSNLRHAVDYIAGYCDGSTNVHLMEIYQAANKALKRSEALSTNQQDATGNVKEL